MSKKISVEDFEGLLSGLGQELNNIDRYLLDVAGPIIDEMKRKSPVDTGDLKKSIRAEVSNNTLLFKMMFYGSFVNYGVRGTKDNKGVNVEFGVEPRPRVEPFYSFKSRRFGIKNANFYNVGDITDEVVEYIENKLIEKI